jgi:uncharacterized membrane protein YqaE (UPF0057 family)
MKYLLAIVLPPLGLLAAGKPFQAILALLLMITLIGWPIAAIWAVLVVNSANADARNKALIAAQAQHATQQEAAPPERGG